MVHTGCISMPKLCCSPPITLELNLGWIAAAILGIALYAALGMSQQCDYSQDESEPRSRPKKS